MDITSLFRTYKDDVFRFALSFVKDVALAEDICQDVFLSLVKLSQSGERIVQGKVKSWLMTATRNTSLNLLKKRGFESATESDSLALEATTTDTYDFEFFALLACLDDTDKQIVTLHIVNGLKHHETAQVLQLKAGTVRQRYARALSAIKTDMEESDL